MSHNILAVCLDCGDTLIDESTEAKTPEGISLSAELIPGADEMMLALKQRGYPLALVADGPPQTFFNNLNPFGLYELFDAVAISGEVGAAKPHQKIFHHALEQLSILPEDYDRVVMVGNHLGRDIKGANDLGIISVWLDWAPRRHKFPRNLSEVPQHTIRRPIELLATIDYLENALLNLEVL